MSSGYLWAVSSDGTPLRLNAKTSPSADDFLEWIAEPVTDGTGSRLPVLKIAAGPNTVFAIDRGGVIYLYVLHSPLTVRVVVETFENQRWYPGIGWSPHTLPTDRPYFSSHDGTLVQPFDSFELPSDGWRWELPWLIDTNELHYDKQGWQYAFNFTTTTFRASQTSTSLVRRRRWVRPRIYTAIERWVQMPIAADAAHRFIDIAAGGFELQSDRSDRDADDCSLYGLTTDGKLVVRRGLRRIQPEGIDWMIVDPIPANDENEFEDISAISCAACNGNLLVLTWDGRIFTRIGIAPDNRMGSAWRAIARPKQLPVLNAMLGSSCIWTATADGRFWWAKLPAEKDAVLRITPDSFTDMGDGVWRLSVSRNDQIFAISQSQDAIKLRCDVCATEPTGRGWTAIMANGGLQTPSTNDDHPQTRRWIQVDAGGCTLTAKTIPKFWTEANYVNRPNHALADRRSHWRQKIVAALTTQSDLIWSTFSDFESSDDDVASTSSSCNQKPAWTRTALIQMLTLSQRTVNWSDATAHLSVIDANSSQGVLKIETRRGAVVSIELSNILTAFSKPEAHSKNVLLLRHTNNDKHATTMKLAFNSEDERDFWSNVLQVAIQRRLQCEKRAGAESSVWFLDEDNQLYASLIAPVRIVDTNTIEPVRFAECRWLQLRGHFTQISAGAERVVWAIGNDGSTWASSPDFDVFSTRPDQDGERGHSQSDTVTETIYEHERYSMLSGFATFNGRACGQYFAWSDESGRVQKTKLETRLPNRYWQWSDSDWIRAPSMPAVEDVDGWLYARRFGCEFDSAKGNVRRRRWRRTRCMFMPAPWIRVEAPRCRRLSVQPETIDGRVGFSLHNEGNAPINVFVVTDGGQLLCRDGVTQLQTTGNVWIEIATEKCLRDVAVGFDNRVWALTSDDRVLLRSCANARDILACDWTHVEPPSGTSLSFTQIVAGRNSTALLGIDGTIFLRRGITRSTPQGTAWTTVAPNADTSITCIAIDSDDRLFSAQSSQSHLHTFARQLKQENVFAETHATKRDAKKGEVSSTELHWEIGLDAKIKCISLAMHA